MRLGLVPRLERLVESDATTDDQATALVDAARTLVSPEGANMGAKFKVLSFHHEALHVEGFE
jgi:SAM-dependent MidA family methyltransferase